MDYTKKRIAPFFTFMGEAEEAINYYISIFPNSKILSMEYFNKDIHGDIGEDGKVINCVFELMGEQFIAMDIEKKHGVPFSWAISIFINCTSEDEFDCIFKELSNDGTIMMNEPLLGLKNCAWVTDKFNVTWQLIIK